MNSLLSKSSFVGAVVIFGATFMSSDAAEKSTWLLFVSKCHAPSFVALVKDKQIETDLYRVSPSLRTFAFYMENDFSPNILIATPDRSDELAERIDVSLKAKAAQDTAWPIMLSDVVDFLCKIKSPKSHTTLVMHPVASICTREAMLRDNLGPSPPSSALAPPVCIQVSEGTANDRLDDLAAFLRQCGNENLTKVSKAPPKEFAATLEIELRKTFDAWLGMPGSCEVLISPESGCVIVVHRPSKAFTGEFDSFILSMLKAAPGFGMYKPNSQ